MRRDVIVVLLVITLLAAVGCAKAPVPTKVAASELYAEYEANEVAADLKYKDKLLEVSGVVTDIGISQTIRPGTPVLFLAESLDAPFMEGVTIHLSVDQKDKVATLSIGDTVTVVGICEGIALVRGTEQSGFRGVRLKDCSLVEASAPSATPQSEKVQSSFSDVKFRTYLESLEPENPLITPNIRICLGSFTITNLSESTVHITKGQVSWSAGSLGGSREGVQVSGDCEPGQTITLRDTSGVDPCTVFPRDEIEGGTLTVELELFSGQLSIGTFWQEFSWEDLLEILYVPGQPL